MFSKVTNGTIKFPMFKDMYELNQKCVWEIETEPQRRISFEFTHFDIEAHDNCNFDKVDVYSIIGEETLKKHGTYCGAKVPARIVSDKNVMKITFSSDQSNVRTGFVANFYTGKRIESIKTFQGEIFHDRFIFCTYRIIIHTFEPKIRFEGPKIRYEGPKIRFERPNFCIKHIAFDIVNCID